ncbi:MAG: amidinotransferase [Candidatus Bathyarchaeota archaeon]|nr:MAG: amidinotransferase [Candidatus Bathyarchaeota archaeon]
MSRIAGDAAHGGEGWSPRIESLRQEIGKVWESCGVDSEWSPLKGVLMHQPGPEIEAITDANNALMIDVPKLALARQQHDALVEIYRKSGISVFYVEPHDIPSPNMMFVADLFFMTPEGAILARPASTVRAGEERFIAQKLAELGIPILRCVRGKGVFEGADASWIDSNTLLIGTGLRTNAEGATQVTSLMKEMDVEVVRVGLPYGAMHLMGTLRFVDRDLAVSWRTRIPYAAVKTLRDHGFTVSFIPNEEEAIYGMALNFVTLEPNKIVMPDGNPRTQSFYENMGIKCETVKLAELHKAAGGIGCLTGILRRESTSQTLT